MTETTNDLSQVPLDERYSEFKQLYINETDSNQSEDNQLLYHLGNMSSYSMTLCALAIVKPELVTTVGGITLVDIFSYLCIATEAAHNILFRKPIEKTSAQAITKLFHLFSNLLCSLRMNRYEQENITRHVFLFAFAALLMQHSMLEKDITIATIPEQLVNWLRSCKPPMLLEYMRVQDNIKNLELNLQVVLKNGK